MTDFITLSFNNNIAEIRLNRPDKKNALNVSMWEAIPSLVATANQSEACKSIILHGGDLFASGADISEFQSLYADDEGAVRGSQAIHNALKALEESRKPVIAAIEGVCIGGGVSLAMACDIRIAGRGTTFGVTPARIGLVYPLGDTRRLVAAIGPSAAKLLLYTGRLVDDTHALSIALIDQLVDAGSALIEARALCAEMGTRSQWSIHATKEMLAGLEAGWRDDGDNAKRLFLESFRNADFAEGHRAFLEKRQANFPIK